MTERYFNLAAEEAMKSNMDFKHGAILTCNGKIIGKGHNHSRNQIKGKLNNNSLKNMPLCSLHSEMHCLLSSHLSRHHILQRYKGERGNEKQEQEIVCC